MSPPPQVVLVRPWTDARSGGGCCGGEVSDGVAPVRLAPVGSADAPGGHQVDCDPDHAGDLIGRTWRLLRAEAPGADVQIVDGGNPWLPASVFRTVRRRSGLRAGLRAASRAGVAGSVLVDGEVVGDLTDLGPRGVLGALRR